ncbi:MAG: peptide ABC transporter substrate-binding protein [Pseudomonadota bacterium]|nr:peptide ABC transporter substrate-binding protein [Pseudomonadota bacterium]
MNEKMLRDMVEQVRDGQLPRRDFIGRMVALGVGVPLASAMLADVALAQSQEAPYKPTRRGGGGPLRLLLWQGPTLLNPHFATGTKDQEGCRPFYESLARYDADGVLVPVLAAEIPSRANGGIAADGLSTTWKLKKNVNWHDGQPFTADDVVFNWQYATDPAGGAFSTGFYANVKSIEKIDASTVRINFVKPTPIWDRSCSLWLIPKHVFGPYIGAKSREAPANLKPVGTGPYKFVAFTPGDLVRGEANMNYYLPNRPFFDTIEIKGGGDATSAARAVLQTGEFDYAWNVQVEDNVLKQMETGGKGQMVFKPSGNPESIFLNAADPWTEVDGERANVKTKHFAFSDPAVRKAFGLLVDRKSVQDFVYGRAAAATANALNNPVQYNSKAIVAEFNVDKANALLDGAGWKRGADGVRAKDGRRLKLVFQTSINSVRQKVQAIVKQACAKAGIEIELKTVQASVFFSSDTANPDTYGKFFADIEMYLNTRAGTDPDRFMQQWVSWEVCQKSNGWQWQNKCRWSSPEYDKAFRASEQELDPVKRAALFIQMNDMACNAGYVVPVAVRAQVAALSKSISAPLTGWDIDLSGLHDWYRT